MWLRSVTRRGLLGLATAAVLGAQTALADVSHYSNMDDFAALADSLGGFPSQTFRSSSIIAPVFQVNTWRADRIYDASHILLGTIYGEWRAGPMILSAKDLSLVYADQHYDNSYWASVEQRKGESFLTFWQGGRSRFHSNGYCRIYDKHYNLRWQVTAQGLEPSLADMHEMAFTPEGNVIFSVYFNIDYDCTPVGGPANGVLMDAGFQEVNPETNEVVFEWRASEHFGITDSFGTYDDEFGAGPGDGFDFFHINSVEKTEAGNYLISSRNCCLLAFVDGRDGHVIWILGGRKNMFKDLSGGRATNFGWQHDARFYHNQSHITVFDNHVQDTDPCGEEGCQSRGLHLELDMVDMTARVVQELFHPQRVNTGAMGGLQSLPNGNKLIGWGYNPSFVEFAPDGTPVMDVQRGKIGVGFQNDMFAYRVKKFNWVGHPTWPPSIAIDSPSGSTADGIVYLSWNGATEVATWAVLASDKPNDIKRDGIILAQSNRTGFETTIRLGRTTAKYYRFIGAAALAADGTVLGSTAVMDMATSGPVILGSGISTILAPRPPTLQIALGVSMAILGILLGWRSYRMRALLAGLFWRMRYTKVRTEEPLMPVRNSDMSLPL